MPALAASCNFSSPLDPPACVVGVPYSHFFTATGGTPPYWFNIFPGAPPSGLTLNNFTGELSGTPDAGDFLPGETSHNSSMTLVVLDAVPGDESIVICGLGAYLNCLPLTPSCNNPPGGSIGLAYTHTITAIQGIAPYTFAITGGALPTGLAMDAAGNITGIPTTDGLYTFFVTVTGTGDPTNNVATITCQISIGGVVAGDISQIYFYAFGFAAEFAVDCGAPPDGVIGASYLHWVPATGGTPPYTWSIFAGALPGGLTLDAATGFISGIPTTAGVFPFTVQVIDADGNHDEVECSITIVIALAIICDNPPAGTAGVPYSHFFPASGGVPPYTFSISAGALPDGLTLDASTGEVSGTPTIGGTFTFTVRVTDSYAGAATPNTAEVECSITIGGAGGLTGECNNPPAGKLNVSYSHSFTATGGTPPYTFSISSGTLPPGLSLDPATGEVTGIPTASGFYSFTVLVTDADDNQAEVECSIRIKQCLVT